nr:VOC family protein [Ardenticatena sp.]
MTLLASTHIGPVHLIVRDLSRALHFYSTLLGFREQRREGQTAVLTSGKGRPPRLILTARANALPKPPRTTGLYHVAIRLPNRQELARLFARLVAHDWRFHGFSDHKVSEAIYLPDPDGNGLELYRDRPRETWPWQGGQIAMRTDPLDVNALLREASADTRPWTGIHPDTDIGHVHLHVRDLDEAEAFYSGVLGLDCTQRDYPGARFFAAGGYHHHVGTNIWAGQGAPPPPPDAVGLRFFTLVVPDARAVAALITRAEAAGVLETRLNAHTAFLCDPSGNRVLVTTDEHAVV